MHNGTPLLNQCKAFLNMQTSCVKGKPFQGLMAVPNKGTLTLNTPKVSNSKRDPDASADRWVLMVHPLKLQTSRVIAKLCMFLRLLHFRWIPLCVKVMKPSG